MRRRSSANASSEQDQPDSLADHPPTTRPEHDDKASRSTEGLQVKAPDWGTKKRRNDGADAPKGGLVTEQLPIHDTAATIPRRGVMAHEKAEAQRAALVTDMAPHTMAEGHNRKWRERLRSPWAPSPHVLLTTLVAFVTMFFMAQSFLTRQLDVKGCGMSYMRPNYARYHDFDTEHTRFASKYSLYLYREGGVDEDSRACRSLL